MSAVAHIDAFSQSVRCLSVRHQQRFELASEQQAIRMLQLQRFYSQKRSSITLNRHAASSKHAHPLLQAYTSGVYVIQELRGSPNPFRNVIRRSASVSVKTLRPGPFYMQTGGRGPLVAPHGPLWNPAGPH